MNSKNAIEDNYISIDKAAKYLGKLWKFKRSELDEWIASSKSAK